ncbi:MAG TPA: hypothetical protein VNN78_05665 [Burkholderiales bacterium]|nr:hypothetical protein [Burkholderiales bacterium]
MNRAVGSSEKKADDAAGFDRNLEKQRDADELVKRFHNPAGQQHI